MRAKYHLRMPRRALHGWRATSSRNREPQPAASMHDLRRFPRHQGRVRPAGAVTPRDPSQTGLRMCGVSRASRPGRRSPQGHPADLSTRAVFWATPARRMKKKSRQTAQAESESRRRRHMFEIALLTSRGRVGTNRTNVLGAQHQILSLRRRASTRPAISPLLN
jgi:hypothetical protein